MKYPIVVWTCILVIISASLYLATIHGFTSPVLDKIKTFLWDPANAHLLGPITILISALGAWLFAFLSIRGGSKNSRQKSTFDYLSKLSWDQDYIEAKNTFIAVKVGPKKLAQVAKDYEELKRRNGASNGAELTDDEKTTINEHASIKNILNEYEALAIAIKSNALDAKMVRDNIRQTLVDHVNACREFIDHTRSSSDFKQPEKIWCELQSLAQKWSK